MQADLSFGEVDEALYSVRPDESGDIVHFFYSQRDAQLETQTSFDFFFSGEAGTKSPLLAQLAVAQFHPRMAQVKPGSDLIIPKVRKAFPDTAYWNPNVRTGPDGHAKVEFNFPDSLTTWRTTIRAMTDDGKAGGVVTRVLTRKNLIVRLAAPRFFRVGDEVTLRVIAHNYLETAKDVTFALDVAGLDVASGQTQKVNIPGARRKLGGVACARPDRGPGRADRQGADQRGIRRPGDDPAGAALRREAARGRLGRRLLRRGAEPVVLQLSSRLRRAFARAYRHRLRLRWRARSSMPSITSPAIPGAARSRRCPASCPT